jgi:hypothetical protein
VAKFDFKVEVPGSVMAPDINVNVDGRDLKATRPLAPWFIAPATSLKQKPGAPLRLVDPNFDERDAKVIAGDVAAAAIAAE